MNAGEFTGVGGRFDENIQVERNECNHCLRHLQDASCTIHGGVISHVR